MSAVESPCERAPRSNGYNLCSGRLNRVGFLLLGVVDLTTAPRTSPSFPLIRLSTRPSFKSLDADDLHEQ